MFSHAFAGDVTCQAMQMYGGQNCFENTGGILCHEACRHAGENVAGAACRHAGIACGVHPHFSAGMSDLGAMAFQNHNDVVLASKSACGGEAVSLNFDEIGRASCRERVEVWV